MPNVANNPAEPDPWLAVGLDDESVPLWKAVMREIVPDEVRNPARHGNVKEPYSIDAGWSERDYARAAAGWHRAHFSPSDARDWTHGIGIHDQWRMGGQIASEWWYRGFTPDEAWHWTQGDISPAEDAEYSQLFRDAGWHPYSVWALYELCVRGEDWEAERREWLDLPETHALNCARAGLSPSEARERVGRDKDELEAELGARFERRGKIDPFIAMLFNHHIVSWDDEDDEASVPFWARRLWDLHDEDDDKQRRLGLQTTYGGPRVKKPEWKVLEERAERARELASRPRTVRCDNSGGPGELEFRDGMEDWYVHCPECGMTWMGGNGSALPEHNKPGKGQ